MVSARYEWCVNVFQLFDNLIKRTATGVDV